MSIFLGFPHYSPNVNLQASAAFMTAKVDYRKAQSSSLLAKSFNLLWADALNGGFDYFVMQHADVIPDDGYVQTLLGLIQERGADVVSVVLPIKSPEGLTSTGIDGPDKFHPLKRVTMKELFLLPETFGAAELGHPGECLLINTGLFIADLRKPWAKEHCFSIDDIIEHVDGAYRVGVAPEDWQFSRYLYAQGARVLATKAVHAVHMGDVGYDNKGVWGHEHDPAGAEGAKETQAVTT